MSNLNDRLFAAVKACDTPLCLDLIECGADVNARDFYGFSVLYMAVTKGHVATCRALIGQGADALSPANHKNHQTTLLHVAASGGGNDVCLVLLEYGINADAVTEKGESSLHWATEFGNVVTCITLLEHGCNPLLKNHQGWSALDFAKKGGHTECVNVIEAWLSAHAARMVLREIACPGATSLEKFL